MRVLWILLPVALMAQTPAAKPPAAAAKPAAAKPAAAKAAPAAAKPAPAPALATDDQKIVYAIGLAEYRRLRPLEFTSEDFAVFLRAMKDVEAGKPAIDLNEWGPKIQAFAQARLAKAAEKQQAEAKVYLDKAAAEPGAVRTEAGVIYRELTPGSGASPKATDTVKVHYRGTLLDGTEFDSSYKRNEPAEFPLSGVIRCWTEGVQKMKVGGKAKLICPSDLAYGPAGKPPTIPGGATLIFEIELLEIPAAKR